jgi:two-component system, NarL family, sensor histidine kinase DesK
MGDPGQPALLPRPDCGYRPDVRSDPRAPHESAATPAGDPGEAEQTPPRLGRGLAMTGMLVLFLAAPLSEVISRRDGLARPLALVVALLAFLGLFANLVMTRDRDFQGRPTPRWRIAAITVTGLLLPVIGGSSWLTATGIAGACYAAYLPPRLAVAGVLAAGAFGGVYARLTGADDGAVLVYTLEPLVIGGFAYGSGRRAELIRQLRATRRELARTAVAEERLRIARDLHDLLGHTLSVIAVKAELARRLVPADPARAQREIGEVEAAARRALEEVADAVTGYRRPSLAVELTSARRAVAAAGIRCVLDAPAQWALPPDIDALLAWAVREGATNVIRHSGGTRCDIRLVLRDDRATLEVTDDGHRAAAQPAAAQPVVGQSAMGRPVAGQPTAGEPAAGQSVAGRPVVGRPTAGEPVAGQSVAGRPTAGQPAAGQSVAGRPVVGRPTAGEPAAGQSAAGRPVVGQPTAGEPAAGQSVVGRPTAGEPAAGQSAAGQPPSSAPGAAARWRPGGGHGLAGLAERAGSLGGTLDAGPSGRRGFRLRVSVPTGATPAAEPDSAPDTGPDAEPAVDPPLLRTAAPAAAPGGAAGHQGPTAPAAGGAAGQPAAGAAAPSRGAG